MKRSLYLSLLLVAFAGQVGAGDGPALPFRDWDACPFECCTYRAWTTNSDVDLYQDIGSPAILATVKKGTEVVGVTGVVITKEAGRMKALASVSLGVEKPVKAVPGDVLYILSYGGEGSVRFWFQGALHEDQTEGAEWQVLAEPSTEWWVLVRAASGQVGWSTETQRFDHIDACE